MMQGNWVEGNDVGAVTCRVHVEAAGPHVRPKLVVGLVLVPPLLGLVELGVQVTVHVDVAPVGARTAVLKVCAQGYR